MSNWFLHLPTQMNRVRGLRNEENFRISTVLDGFCHAGFERGWSWRDWRASECSYHPYQCPCQLRFCSFLLLSASPVFRDLLINE